MKKFNIKIYLSTLFILAFIAPAFSADGLRTQFLNGKSVICGINIRNFNSKDLNNNGIIDLDEEKGNFLNAIERLDEIQKSNINTLHLLPITTTGKLKALGTAGSLYAVSDFLSINPQLLDDNSKLKPEEQAKKFITEAHKRGIKIIIDLPSCGSYDMFLTHPEYFMKNKKQLSIVPMDWTDVRLFNTGNDTKLNEDLLEIHKKFIDMIMRLGADGINANVATIKPFNFWKELITYARDKNSEFMFLADASDSVKEFPSKYTEFTPYNKLLEAGFDGYYGSFSDLKDWNNSKDLFEHIVFNKKLLTSYPDKKNVILSFTTHDEVSPVLLHGEDFSVMLCWLYATLPFNPYFIDGFSTGDTYIYPWANAKAEISETDDDYYFVHRGKLDIFNFSRQPKGNSTYIAENFKKALDFRIKNSDLISNGEFNQLKSDKDKVFAYSRFDKNTYIIVIGNFDYKKYQRHVTVKIPGLKKKAVLSVIKGNAHYKIKKNRLLLDLEPGQIKVLKIDNFSL